MAVWGWALLAGAFAACVASVVFLLAAIVAGWRVGRGIPAPVDASACPAFVGDTVPPWAALLSRCGRIAAVVSCGTLVAACLLLVWCFMSGDVSLRYVVEYRSNASGGLGWLYRLSGLWAGREGSLLLWAALQACFAAFVALRRRGGFGQIDRMALAAMQLVLLPLAGTLLLADGSAPFAPMPAEYLDASGAVTGAALQWGLNPLLEHWAMAVHPPTLFVGYAGLAVPFSYALAALALGDPSVRWVARSVRPTLVAWLFLSLGIALGGVWAYVVLGWGGYWGWDAVENASLLPWLMGTALLHGFGVLRRRGMLRRWTFACACLAFAFVLLAAFVTRSGVVGSVHAFSGDPASAALFGGMLAAVVAASLAGLALRWRAFAPAERPDGGEGVLSQGGAHCLSNFVLLAAAVAVAYLTLAPALPAPLPLAGRTFSAAAYNAVAWPLGLLYFALLALCPLLSWGERGAAGVLRRLRVPAACALVPFACLAVYHALHIAPGLDEALRADPSLVPGPVWYLDVLAVAGYAVASLLACTALAGPLRAARRGGLAAYCRTPAAGACLAHVGMAVMLVGLVGSSLFVSQQAVFLAPAGAGAASSCAVGDYTIELTGDSIDVSPDGANLTNTAHLAVRRGGEEVGGLDPAIRVLASSRQQQYQAAVLGSPLEDLFVVYRGTTGDGMLAFDVRVNPLVRFVWAGAALLCAGALVSLAAHGGRRPIMNKTQ